MYQKTFDEFSNLLFLRPENIFIFHRRAVSIYETGYNLDQEPSVDISCGNGLFTFILAEGSLKEEFDMFIDINEDAIYDLCRDKKMDIFNSSDKSLEIDPIKTPSRFQITYGTDWKKNLLNRAKKLNLYRNLILHDNNNPLPFEDNFFKRMFSNSIYWVENISQHIKEIYRTVAPGGIVILQIRTEKIMDFSPFKWELPWLSQASRVILDRGRRESWKSMKPIDWWLLEFKKIGFKKKDIRPVFSREQAIIWQAGLRPIAHFLVLLFNKLKLEERTKLKKEFIDYIRPIIFDIANIEPKEKDAFEYTIVLGK